MENLILYRDVDEEGVSESPFISMQQRSNQHRLANVKETTLLIVDSDVLQANELGADLAFHDFLPTVVHSAEASWTAVSTSTFDVIVLDAMLEEGEDAGFELAQRLRDAGFRQPILFLTSRNELVDRIRAHEHGDDHLGKPVELLELVAKLEALSRRGLLPPRAISWRELKLVPTEHAVYRSGDLVNLTAVEYKMLKLFMHDPDRLFLYDEILERVWGKSYTARSNLLMVHIKNVRAKVGSENFVEAVRGVGYRLGG